MTPPLRPFLCPMEVSVASIEYSQVRKGMVIVGEDGQLY